MQLLEVFADVACPFAHVGLRRIAAMRSEMGRDDIVLHVRAWPLELVNGAPLDPRDVVDHARELHDSVAPDLFEGFDPRAVPATTLPALDLVAAAYAVDPDTGERVSLDVRTALFEESRDITDADVLASIARAHGVDISSTSARATVLGDWAEGRRRGVRGSPEFFVDDRGYFCPALEIEKVDGHLDITFDSTGFEEFMSDLFAS